MDGVDADILRAALYNRGFQWDFRTTLADAAKATGLDEETVRVRLKRLEAEGVLRGWHLIPNPALLGRAFLRIVTRAADGVNKDDAIARLGLVDGVLWVFDHLGPSFGVVAMVEPGGPSERLHRLVEATTRGPTHSFPIPTEAPTLELSPRDWRLVAALRKGPRDRFADVAARAGLSEKTARRRVDEFVEGHVAFLNPVLDFTKARGMIPVEIKVFLEEPKGRERLDDYLRGLPHRTFSRFDGSVSQLSFMAQTPGEVEDVRRRLRDFSGGGRAQVEVTVRRLVFDAWLDELIDRRSRDDAKPRAKPPQGKPSVAPGG